MPELRRSLSLFSATNIVVADMIGAGIFTTSGLLLAQLGNPRLMLVLWAAGGILALCGALSYGTLGASMPKAGGEYVYLSELYHPVFGFLSGWVSFFAGFSAPLAASAVGFSEYLGTALPDGIVLGDAIWTKRLVAGSIIVVLALIHTRGLDTGAGVQNALTVGKVGLLIVLIGVGFAFGSGDVLHFFEDTRPAGSSQWRSIGLSLMWIMFAYSGWNATGYIGSEIRAPRRNLPLSLLAGTFTVLVLYLLLNALFVYGASPATLSGEIAVGGIAAGALLGDWAARLVSAVIAFALLSAISALIILGPRIYYAMARDGHFFRFAGAVHPRYGVPSRSILLQASIGLVMVMTGTFDQILTYMGFCLGIFPILAVLGVFRLHARKDVRVPPAVAVASVIFAMASIAILVLAYQERPVESSIAVATIALGIPAYFYFRSRRDVETLETERTRSTRRQDSTPDTRDTL